MPATPITRTTGARWAAMAFSVNGATSTGNFAPSKCFNRDWVPQAPTISEIPPDRCTTSATADRQRREVCASHAITRHVHWFDDDDARVPQLQS
jgi:hypothetical protein